MLATREPATTNLYLYRLAKSVVAARGGALTVTWNPQQRRQLGAKLLSLPATIEVVPIEEIAFRMAEIATDHRVSTLGAECVAAAEHLEAPLCVWEGDDGPRIRAAIVSVGLEYRTLAR